MEDEWFRDSVPLDWERAEQFRDIVRVFRNLIWLRRNLGGDSGAMRGQHVHLLDVDKDRKTVVFHRADDNGGHAVVAANFSAHPVTGTIGMPGTPGATWRVRFNSDASTYSSLFGDHATPDILVDEQGGGHLDVGPYSLVILTL